MTFEIGAVPVQGTHNTPRQPHGIFAAKKEAILELGTALLNHVTSQTAESLKWWDLCTKCSAAF